MAVPPVATSAGPDRAGRWVLAISGAAGFAIGCAYADWQVAVETAQVLAGLVRYPADNPFFLYHVNLWTLQCQTLALALYFGATEVTLSVVVSGLMGMLSFQALAMVIYGLGGDAVLAVGAVFVILVSRAFDFGAVYPIWLVGTVHTYGTVGLSFAALTIGLLGAGWRRTGAFMVGLAPAVHPSIGAWLVVIVSVAAIWDRAARQRLPALGFFALGVSAASLSFAVQMVFASGAVAADPVEAERVRLAFMGFWDGHRRPVNLGDLGVWINLGLFVLAAAWLRLGRERLGAPVAFLLRVLVVASALSLVLALVTTVPIDQQPRMVALLMPGRMLNFGALLAAAVVFGLGASLGRGLAGALVTGGLAIGLLFSSRADTWPSMGAAPVEVWRLDAVVLLSAAAAAALWVLWRRASTGAVSDTPGGRRLWWMVTLPVLAAAVLISSVGARASVVRGGDDRFRDRTNDFVLFEAARGTGLLASAGDMQLVQLRTRRPVLLDGGGLDGLVYAPASAPAVARMLREVYGVDVFDPPDEARHGGRVPVVASRAAWEGYSMDRWQMIRRDFGVTAVLTPGDWRLNLPPGAERGNLRYYIIPE